MLKLICMIPRPLSAVGMPHFRKTWPCCAVELEFASCQKSIDNVGYNYICPADCKINLLNVMLTFELADDENKDVKTEPGDPWDVHLIIYSRPTV